MKSLRKKALVLILSLSMCISLMPIMVFAEEEPDTSITYVALGDSMAQGYMFLDYTENSNEGHYCGWEGSSSYGYIKEFATELEKDAKRKVNLIDLTVQGEQPDEVCAFLEGYSKEQIDTMTQGARKHIGWWVGDYETDEEQDPNMFIFPTFDEMSQYFIDSIKAADVITYDLGMNYFGTYLNDKRGENETYDTLLTDGLIKLAVQSFKFLMDAYLDSSGATAFKDRMDGILYAYASYIKYTEQCLKDIYELNPDVEIILVPLANPNRDLYYDISGVTINYTDIVDLTMDSLNNYVKTLSAYKDKVTIATLNGDVVSFADELYLYPDTLSADAEALLEKVVLGYEDKIVPQIVMDNFNFWYDTLAEWGASEEEILGMFNGVIDYVGEDGQGRVESPVFDDLVYNYISKKYGEEVAFNDFYGENYAPWTDDFFMTGGATVTLLPCIIADTMDYQQNPYYLSVTIHDYNIERARTAIKAGTALPWQKHLIEAVDNLLVNWKELCLKAATYRTLPLEYLTEEIPSFSTERIVELLQDPSTATDDEMKILHAGIRNGSAARGFGAHPCPRGLEVKHEAVLTAYKTIRTRFLIVDHISLKNPTKLNYFGGEELDTTDMIVTAFYLDGTSEEVTDYTLSGYDNTKFGAQEITVTYNGKTATFSINVTEKTLSSIEMANAPTKVTYGIGEKISVDGAQIKLIYNNGDSEIKDVTSDMISDFSSDKSGDYDVTVTYLRKKTTFTVHITDLVKGDVNGDGEVTDKDAIHLLYHILFKDAEEYAINQSIDMNNDGEENDKDAIYLLYHTLFPSDYPLN